ncbi:MAG: hypothetical protein LBH45_04800 [Campylobacteraceae bacterium]|nr:hypothetical protein [Campylobacteraceae bacterium]
MPIIDNLIEFVFVVFAISAIFISVIWALPLLLLLIPALFLEATPLTISIFTILIFLYCYDFSSTKNTAITKLLTYLATLCLHVAVYGSIGYLIYLIYIACGYFFGTN